MPGSENSTASTKVEENTHKTSSGIKLIGNLKVKVIGII